MLQTNPALDARCTPRPECATETGRRARRLTRATLVRPEFRSDFDHDLRAYFAVLGTTDVFFHNYESKIN